MLSTRSGVIMQKELTLILVRDGSRILLGKKKRGFGMGRYNGFGGKLIPNETPLESVKRELFEEAQIKVQNITKIGEINFYLKNNENQDEIHFVHVYLGTDIVGEPEETEEMAPKWFNIDDIPYQDMWPDDIYWYPYALEEIPFSGYCRFSKDNTTIIDYEFKKVLDFK